MPPRVADNFAEFADKEAFVEATGDAVEFAGEEFDGLGDGSSLGVEITYSHDPEHPVGKGDAVRNALDNGSIPSAHLTGEIKGMIATPVLALGQAFASTGMMVVENKIVDTEMYPMIPVPAHVGITVF